jgi:hypothetical protein
MRVPEYPGVVFRDGPTGIRAALVRGPDIWEVVRVVREVEKHGQNAFAAASELLSLPVDRLRSALRYYAAHSDEIDAEVRQADEASLLGENAWRARQRSTSD